MSAGSYTAEVFKPFIATLAPKIIVECGARDCNDSLDLVRTFSPSRLYAFECNPDSLHLCRAAAAMDPRITLIEKAAWITDGTITFYPVDMQASRFKETGVSSVFVYTRDDATKQYKIEVPAIRMDTFMAAESLPGIDLLCMDTQGAELSILKSFGDRIKDVRAILLEVMFSEFYKDAPKSFELDGWIKEQGFVPKATDNVDPGSFANILYVRP